MRTTDLPLTPVRDREIRAADWDEAPATLPPDALYRRRIGGWLVWRAGPPKGEWMRYFAFDPNDLSRMFVFGPAGAGPSGATHDRFRTFKEDLRDHPVAP